MKQLDLAADLQRRLLLYAVGLGLFLLVPPTLKATVGPPGAFTAQELLDLLTPVVAIPLAWWVLEGIRPIRGWWLVAALLLSIAWIDAHGIHLAANAIGDAFASGPERDAFYATTAGDLDHWLDEGLGHWEWHLAWAGLTVLLLLAARARPPVPSPGRWPAVSLGGAIHGITYFVVTTEGGTAVLLGMPLSALIVALTARDVAIGAGTAVSRFFLIASLVSLALWIGWLVANGGRMVEPCEVLHC